MADIKEGLNNSEVTRTQPTHWKSLKQLYNNPEFIEASHHEFKDGVKDNFEVTELSGISRRKFLALVGASAALAGAGCTDYRDKGEIIPYNKRPEEITPGIANYYASYINCKCGGGVLIKTREGRPIKIDGNPDHPVSQGKVCAKCHASILGLYDPERISSPRKKVNGGNFEDIFWEKADREIRNALSEANGKEIAIITHSITSPTTLKVLQDFSSRYPSTKIYSYELVNDKTRNSAWKKCYGSETYPLIKWDEAKIILSIEGDFLGIDKHQVENSRLFVKRRDVSDPENFSRLYAIEGDMSVTGMNADYRLRLRPDAHFEFVTALINEVAKRTGGSVGNYSLDSAVQKYSLPKDKLDYLVNDLLDNLGSSIVYAGDIHSEKTHIAVNYLNEILGNKNLYRYENTAALQPLNEISDFKTLASAMNNGKVGAVIHFDSNPVYHLPEDSGYADALKKVDTVITITELENESSYLSKYVLPIHHSLESWGDAKTRTGFYSMQQPVISPILDTRQKEAILLNWIENDSFEFKENLYHEYLKANWQENIYPSLRSGLAFNQFWVGALHDGVVRADETAPAPGSFNASTLSELNLTNDVSGYAVALKESYQVGDGRYSNNGWLQELPHPVTKVTWDNYAAISAAAAKELDVDYNDFIEIEIESRKFKIPVFIQPGAADKTVTIELGFGRTHAGTVANGVGFNANKLLTSSPGLSPYLFTSAKVNKAEGSYEIVTAQEHHSFDDELTRDAAARRGIIKEGTVKEYIDKPGFLHEGKGHKFTSFYPDYEYTGLKWGMAIDLNKCTGCGECVVACTAENNIPVVGKDQVQKGREMHWIRIDRYYTGPIDEPDVSNQVMLCQHCDNAPCENVCPVVATTHSPDGLNQMIYNRCVGTRYCSNNCPYKVRRFNFYDFRDFFSDGYQLDNLFNMVYNPEVTVRSRGVMEKCTFCIQRIMEAREDAIGEKRQLKGSDVKTACQEACITNAITFGDVSDKESDVSKSREHGLAYHILEELNVRPNVTYIAKLRNTHKESV
jgi:MoCo/4Fe-4S cofactor protein with predicted Tat translocation signal